MFVGILGALIVRDATGAALDVGRGLPSRLLAVLALAEGRPVSPDALMEALWDHPPRQSAQATMHSTVSRLRRVIDRDRDGSALLLDAAGYRLDVGPDQIDGALFARLAGEGRSLVTADPKQALERLEAADALWRGPALAEYADKEFARASAARLEALRIDALEDAMEARLAIGAGPELLARLTDLAQTHPLRERLRGQRALALYRGGRQSEALAEIGATRDLLREELGIDPGPSLRDLELRMLRQDPALDAARPVVRLDADPPVSSHASEGRPPSSARAPDPGVTGIAGRDGELALLKALLGETRTGSVRFALVEGEPGIGKTRLLEEVAAEAAGAGMRAVWGRCADSQVAPAYWPWLEALRALRSQGVLGEATAELSALLDPAAAESTLGDAPRFRLFEVITEALVSAAAAAPLVVLVEDLHWADPASAELLNHLSVRLHGVPVAVVGSLRQLEIGRDDAVTAMVAAVVRRDRSRRLTLHPVPSSATAALIRDAVGVEVALPVASAIHRRGEGNPFFIGELSRLLRDAGRLDDPDAATSLRVPVAVRDVVRRRLSGLPAPTRRVLESAAVLGGDAELSVIARASGLSMEECIEEIEPALASRMLVTVEEQPGRFAFAHALVRDATLTEIPPLRLAQLHARAADALSEVYGEDDDVAEAIATHRWRGVSVVGHRQAATALERASDVALRRTAYETADDLLTRALSLWRAAGAQEAELVATVRLVSMRRGSLGYQRAYESMPLDRAEELALRCGRMDLYLGILLAEWGSAGTGGDIPRTVELGRRIRGLAADSDDAVIRFIGGMAWPITCWHVARLAEADAAVSVVEEELERISAEDMERLTDIDSAALLFAFLVHIKTIAGTVEPEDRFDRLARRFTRPYDLLVVANFAGLTAYVRGDVGAALRWGEFGTRQDRAGQFPFFGGACQVYQGWAMGQQGDVDAGLALVERGHDRWHGQAGARTGLGVVATARVDLMLLAGRPVDEVERYLDEMEARVHDSGERVFEPLIALARAQVARARGRHEEAASALTRAADMGREAGIDAVRLRVEAFG